MSLDRFSPPVRACFEGTFEAPTPAQERGWPAISKGSHTLILAPTGSGKTLAAFLWALDRLTAEPPPPAARRCRVLYVSPLRALAVDVEKNLRAPLTGIGLAAERQGASSDWPDAIASLVKDGRVRRIELSRIDGEAASASPFADALRGAGFADGYRGLTLRA